MNKNTSAEEISPTVEILDQSHFSSLIDQPSTEIYFYSDVTTSSILNLRKQIDNSTKYIKTLKIQHGIDVEIPIKLHICSVGGELTPALGLSDIIKHSEIPIYTYVEGTAASAATMLSIAGHKRFITKQSTMLIHQLWGETSGNYKFLSDDNKNFILLMSILEDFYTKNTKLTKKMLKELLSSDLYLGSEQCKKYGFVDVIL